LPCVRSNRDRRTSGGGPFKPLARPPVKPIYELAAGPVPFRARLMNGDLTEEALQGNGAAPLGAPPSAGTQGGRTNVEFIPRILSDLRPLDRSRRTEAGHRRLDGDRQIHDLRAPEALRYHGLRATHGGSKALLRSQPLRLHHANAGRDQQASPPVPVRLAGIVSGFRSAAGPQLPFA